MSAVALKPVSDSAADEEPPAGAVEAIVACAHLHRRGHVMVLGEGSLSLSLRLWRAGFVHVSCAPRKLDLVAHGAADALIIQQVSPAFDLGAAITRSQGALRRGGALLIHVMRGAGRAALADIRARLERAGFSAGAGFADADGLWLTARRQSARPSAHLRVIGRA